MTDKEKNEMFERNKGLIYLAINKLGLNKKQDDFYDIGLIGITHGINNYDASKGYKESTYLYTCIYHQLIRHIKLHYKRDMFRLSMVSMEKQIGNDIYLYDAISDSLNIEEELIKKENIERMYKCIDKLKPEYKYIVLSTFGLKCKKKNNVELEKELGISHQAINCKYHFALRDLKRLMGGKL